jgi:hypothetical protein
MRQDAESPSPGDRSQAGRRASRSQSPATQAVSDDSVAVVMRSQSTSHSTWPQARLSQAIARSSRVPQGDCAITSGARQKAGASSTTSTQVRHLGQPLLYRGALTPRDARIGRASDLAETTASGAEAIAARMVCYG